VIARLRARLAQEDGMTLIELLTTMTVLALVMTGILVMFTSGLRATDDLNARFQAQQNARLALSALRNDIGSACTVTVGTVTGETAGSQVTLVLPNTATPTAGANSCTSGTTTVIWCAASASHAAPFALYRSTAATCSSTSGVQKAASLKCAGLPLTGCTTAVFQKTTSATTRPTVTVTFPVEANLTNTHGLYTLADTIMARNAGVNS
jgi:prepilin-type N-terminal cleavage/methylation domain-containing protein